MHIPQNFPPKKKKKKAYLTQKNDNPDPKKLERLWIEPRNMFMTLKKTKKESEEKGVW